MAKTTSPVRTGNSGASDPVVIAAAARTAIGAFQGGFAGVSATELGATAIRAAVDPDS